MKVISSVNIILPNRKLSFYELKLLPEAIFELTVARVKISFIPGSFRLVRLNSLRTDIKPGIKEKRQALNPVEIAKLIESLALRLPWNSTCLVKAVAAHRILKRREVEHRIHFGVRRDESGNLEAHAWLSLKDRIILGDGRLNEFHELKPFGE